VPTKALARDSQPLSPLRARARARTTRFSSPDTPIALCATATTHQRTHRKHGRPQQRRHPEAAGSRDGGREDRGGGAQGCVWRAKRGFVALFGRARALSLCPSFLETTALAWRHDGRARDSDGERETDGRKASARVASSVFLRTPILSFRQKKPTAKTERLRQAKAEAEREIAAYRAEREAGYQKRLAEVGRHVGRKPNLRRRVRERPRRHDAPPTSTNHPPSTHNTNTNKIQPPQHQKQKQCSSGSAQMEERMRAETEQQVAQLRADVAAKKQGVVEMLARHVTTAPLPTVAK
jgi:hypothetical protein